jgi:hypothetical protein
VFSAIGSAGEKVMTNNDDIRAAMEAVQARPRPPRPAKPPKPQPPKPPAPPPPMVEEALALIERPPPPPPDEREMNELIRRTWEDSKRLQRGRGWNRSKPEPAPVAYPPRPPFHHALLVKSDDQPAQELPPFLLARPAAVTGRTESDPYSDTGGRGKRTTGALGEAIQHCFGNYAHWRKIQKSPE